MLFLTLEEAYLVSQMKLRPDFGDFFVAGSFELLAVCLFMAFRKVVGL